MELRESLVMNKPRENSGSSSSNRFQYQKDWALCKLLELQLSGKEYVLILDFHDDILIIDSDKEPNKAIFYQIKTKKDSSWSLNALIKRGTNEIQSIIGNFVYNRILFLNQKIEINFITNAKYNFKLAEVYGDSKNYNNICLSIVTDAEKDKLRRKLTEEFSQEKVPQKIREEFNEEITSEILDITNFQVSDLGINGHDTYTIGKLSETFNDIKVDNKVNATVAYRMLAGELEKRNDYEWNLQSFEEIIKIKGISKKYFTQLIEKLINQSKNYELWQNIENNLLQNGIGIRKVKKLKENWTSYEIERMDANNIYLQDVKRDICKIISNMDDCNSYMKFCNEAYRVFLDKYGKDEIYDEDYIKSIILMEFAYE
ncbi:hypothetical protein DIC82_05625 [Clostridium beijerinckii]|nr:hypothetical protein DIC82_05625 [Clostridium beijerinckii]